MSEPLTREQTAAAVADGMRQAQNTLDIRELPIDGANKFEQTKIYRKWIALFDIRMKPFEARDAKDKEAMLLIAIGEDAYARYQLETPITTEANEYLNARKRLEKIFCLPAPKIEANIEFQNINPMDDESPLAYIERLRSGTQMCEFTNPDQEVMRMMLAKCPNQKWQEQRAIKKWDHTKLADAEEYARILEQTQSFTKKLKKTYPSTSKVNAVRVEKCRNCGLEHDKGRCPAYNKECFKCSQLHHFASLCRQTRRNPRGRGGFSNRRSGQRGSRRSYQNRGGRNNYRGYNSGYNNYRGNSNNNYRGNS